MPFPAYGAFGHVFVASRLLQILTLLITIGLTSHCINTLIHDSIDAPGRLIGHLTISCLGTVYAAFSFVLYIDSALPLLLSAICDACFFFAFIALSVLFGENVVNLSCRPSDINIPVPDDRHIVVPPALGKDSFNGKVGVVSRIMREKRDQAGDNYTGYHPSAPIPQEQTQTLYASLRHMDFGEWVRSSQRGCQMMKGTWAVGIVILVLFLVSMGSLMGLWWNLRKQQKQDRQHRESKIEDNIQWST